MDVVLYISPFCLQRLLNRTENKNNTVRTTIPQKSFENLATAPCHKEEKKKTKHKGSNNLFSVPFGVMFFCLQLFYQNILIIIF